MTTVFESRVASAVTLLWVLLPLTKARSADVPLHRAPATASAENTDIPRQQSRQLSRLEIFQVIQNDLAQKGTLAHGRLRPEDLQIQSTVPARKDDMGLQVKRISFDRIRRETVFQLWTSYEPQYLPFAVTTRRDPQSLGLGSVLALISGDASRGACSTVDQEGNRVGAKPAVLARPGMPATLVMLGENVRITTTVVALQPGTRGQHILVRDPATARVMNAEVVDRGLLRTSF